MSTQGTVVSFEQFVQDFDGLFQRRVFRLECLDWYDAPNEREPYARFLAGEPADWAWREPWKRLVRGHRAAGRIIQRVHVVSEPVGDYIRFMLLRGYPANVEAGEDVRILGRDQAGGLVNGGDFWLFDDRLAACLIYDEDGCVERVEMDDSPFFLVAARAVRNEALRLASPLAKYVAEHNITERKHAA